MTSSPTNTNASSPTRQQRLLALLEQVPDPRALRGRRYRLSGILAAAVTAVLSGAQSFAAIGEWMAALGQARSAELGLGGGAPDESTLRKLFARLDADAIDELVGAWMFTRTTVVDGKRVIAMDGKSLRGAQAAGGVMPHLVAALDHASGTVVGQVAVDDKSNEIPAVRTLLGKLDLEGAVVTVDAMHTQIDTAEKIINAGGDYVCTVKGNTPKLRAALKALPWKGVPDHRTTDTGHGRRATRTIKVIQAPDWIDFPGARQVAQLRRTVTRRGRKTVEVVYLITSADYRQAPPATLAAWVRGHWGIEDRLHFVRDTTLAEDHSQVRTGNAPRIMASLRNTAISLLRLHGWDNIAAAFRHHARTPGEATACLLTR